MKKPKKHFKKIKGSYLNIFLFLGNNLFQRAKPNGKEKTNDTYTEGKFTFKRHEGSGAALR